MIERHLWFPYLLPTYLVSGRSKALNPKENRNDTDTEIAVAGSLAGRGLKKASVAPCAREFLDFCAWFGGDRTVKCILVQFIEVRSRRQVAARI